MPRALCLRHRLQALRLGIEVVLRRGLQALHLGIGGVMRRKFRALRLGIARVALISLASEAWII